MKVQNVAPFVDAAAYVLEQCIPDARIRRGELKFSTDPHISAGITTFIGLTGTLRGRVVYDMSKQTAISIASEMNNEKQVGMNTLVRSTISELANMMTGNAATRLNQSGQDVDITPPTFIIGTETEVYSYKSMGHLIVPIETRCGLLILSLSVTDEQG
ncbi:MAG: chemotaxis protein CheX [Candidatus Hydrogenedentota bacterium]